MSKPKVTHVTMKDSKGKVVYKRTPNSVTLKGAMAQNFMKALEADLKKSDGKNNRQN